MSMSRAWKMRDGVVIARKVKNASRSAEDRIRDSGRSTQQCPNCHFTSGTDDNEDDRLSFPAGVKFDPSDLQLVEHLEAKCGVGGKKPNLFIDEYIPTVEGDQGINYTHPENLPGAVKDGSGLYFFHRTRNAYSVGQRKRRRIESQHGSGSDAVSVRWHKTGKTKAVMKNGVQKGCKKIMVLYKASKKGCKPYKSNWVMHQYHLGAEEEEIEGEFVVSKIFFQQNKRKDKDEDHHPDAIEDSVVVNLQPQSGPTTPSIFIPNRNRPEKSIMEEDIADDITSLSTVQKTEHVHENPDASQAFHLDDTGCTSQLAGGSQPTKDICPDGLEPAVKDPGQTNYTLNSVLDSNTNYQNPSCGIADLENNLQDFPLREFSPPPSQDSLGDCWLDLDDLQMNLQFYGI